MATITSTVDNISMSSTFTCTTTWYTTYSSSGNSDFNLSFSASASSLTTQSITFTYDNTENEPINMAVLSLASISNTYGGSLQVNGTKVYPSNGVYTIYLEPADLGEASATFELGFSTYTQAHSHQTAYDSITQQVVSGGSQYGTIKYTSKKSHTGTIELGDITLKIYTGDDFVAVPSTSALYVGVGGVAKKITEIYASVNGIAKKISGSWIGIRGIAQEFQPCLELQHIVPGEIVQIDETGTGTLVDYIVVAQDHYLNETNTERHTVLMRKNLLNTTSTFGDNTTGEAYIGEALDNYVNEAWKATLDGKIILKLMNITIPCNKWDSPYTSSAERQVWVPSWSEIKETYTDEPGEGTCFEYFIGKDTNTDRIAKTSDGTANMWWTRSCIKGMGQNGALIRVIAANGALNSYNQGGGGSGYYCRPVFCLSAGLPISKVSEGIYNLVF